MYSGFTSTLLQMCTCLQLQISGLRVASLRCCAQHCKTALRKYRIPRLPQRKNLNFRHLFNFTLHLLCDFWRTQGCCKVSKAAARLPRDYPAMTLCFIARLPLVAKPYFPLLHISLSCDPCWLKKVK